MLEIERKFLVKGDFRPFVTQSTRIVQGYLSTKPECTVRVRIKNEKGFFTVKTLCDKSGLARNEWENEIPLAKAEALMKICEPEVIDKIRHLAPAGNHTFEIDEFFGENEGLIIAEIELTSENEIFENPAFLGKEVTGNIKYYNSMLSKHPYKKW